MLADILNAETDLADWCFLVAFVLALVATILAAINPPHRLAPAFAFASLAAIALGLLAL